MTELKVVGGDHDNDGPRPIPHHIKLPSGENGTAKLGYEGFLYPCTHTIDSLPVYYRRYAHIHEPRMEDFYNREKPRKAKNPEPPRRKKHGFCPWFRSHLPFYQTDWRVRWTVFKYRFATEYYLIRIFMSSLFSLWVLLTSVVSGLACWGAFELELFVNLPITIFASAIIFPMSFGISSAYSRRDRVLLDIGMFLIFLLLFDFFFIRFLYLFLYFIFLLQKASIKTSFLEVYVLARNWTRHRPDSNIADTYRSLLLKQLQLFEELFTHHGGRRTLFKIYRNFDRMGTLNEQLRDLESYLNGLFVLYLIYFIFLLIVC